MANNNDIRFKKHNRLLFYSVCGMIPLFLFAVWLILASFISPGYNGGGDYISPVTVGFYAMIQNLVFVALGLLTIGLAFGLRIGLPPRIRLLKMGVWSFIIFGLCVFLAGLLQLLGLLPENYLLVVPYNLLTVTGFAVTILAYIAAILLISKGLKYEDSLIWGKYRRYSISTGVLFIILLILLIMAIFYNFYPGVSQRAFIIILWVWILITGVKMYLISANKRQLMGRWI